MSEQRDLKSIQGWMQTVITDPRGVEQGISSAAARSHVDISVDQIGQMVTRSSALTAVQRLGIYSHAYFARLQECLRAEFPVLLYALGGDLFNRFTFDYLYNYPPQSYTLNRLGENFPSYLAKSRPDRDAPPDKRESWPDFIIDLARLERTFSEVFDGPGLEGQLLMDADQLSAIPTEQLLEGRSVPAICLRLLAFRFPVSQYFNAVRHKENPDLPAPLDTFLAMMRRDYVVNFYELSRQQYDLLRDLITGQTLAQAIAATVEATSIDRERFSKDALDWLRDWVSKGFFFTVEGYGSVTALP